MQHANQWKVAIRPCALDIRSAIPQDVQRGLDARVGAALSLAGAPTFLVFVVPVFSTLVLPVLVLVARWGFPSLVFPDVPVVLAVPCLLFLVL